jgi:hypothetical protein
MNNTYFINYALNKFCPYVIIAILLFYNSGLDIYRAAGIILACFFVDKFSFKTGYSVAYCETNNINLND